MSKFHTWEDFMNDPTLSWQKQKLGDLFNHRQEKNRPDLPLLSVTGSGGVVDRDSLERRDTSNANKTKYWRVQEGDIVYNTMRMWQGVSGSSHKQGIVSPAYTVIEPRDSIDEGFAKYLVKSELLIQKFHQNSQGLVDDILNLKFQNFAPISVRIPSFLEQKKIASILISVDEVIVNTTKQIDKLQDLKKATMNELLTKGIGHTEFKDNKLGRIPKSWEVRKLGQCLISKPQYGAGEPAIKWDNHLVRYIRITDIQDDGKLDEIAKAGILPASADGYLLEPGDVLIARTGTVGKSYLHYETNYKFAFAGYLVRFRTNKSTLLPNFFFQYTLSDIYQKWIKSMSRVGAQPNINATEYSEMVLPVPDVMEQKEINNILRSFDEQVELLRAKLNKTQSLKKSLMQDLLTGKLRVKVN